MANSSREVKIIFCYLESQIVSIKQYCPDVGEDAEKEDLFCMLLGMQAGAATLENRMGVPQKIKNRTSLRPSNCTTR